MNITWLSWGWVPLHDLFYLPRTSMDMTCIFMIHSSYTGGCSFHFKWLWYVVYCGSTDVQEEIKCLKSGGGFLNEGTIYSVSNFACVCMCAPVCVACVLDRYFRLNDGNLSRQLLLLGSLQWQCPPKHTALPPRFTVPTLCLIPSGCFGPFTQLLLKLRWFRGNHAVQLKPSVLSGVIGKSYSCWNNLFGFLDWYIFNLNVLSTDTVLATISVQWIVVGFTHLKYRFEMQCLIAVV